MHSFSQLHFWTHTSLCVDGYVCVCVCVFIHPGSCIVSREALTGCWKHLHADFPLRKASTLCVCLHAGSHGACQPAFIVIKWLISDTTVFPCSVENLNKHPSSMAAGWMHSAWAVKGWWFRDEMGSGTGRMKIKLNKHDRPVLRKRKRKQPQI